MNVSIESAVIFMNSFSYLPTEYSSVRIRIANESKFDLKAWDKRVQNKFILTTINTNTIDVCFNNQRYPIRS